MVWIKLPLESENHWSSSPVQKLPYYLQLYILGNQVVIWVSFLCFALLHFCGEFAPVLHTEEYPNSMQKNYN